MGAVIGGELALGVSGHGIRKLVLPCAERHSQGTQIEPHGHLRLLADGEQVRGDAAGDGTAAPRHPHDDDREDHEREQQNGEVQQDRRGEHVGGDRAQEPRQQRGDAAEGQRSAGAHDLRRGR